MQSGTYYFFSIFSKLSGFGGASMRTAAALHRRGQGTTWQIFGVIWGRFFFDQKSTFFNFDFNKKWFGGGFWKKKMRTFFFLRAL